MVSPPPPVTPIGAAIESVLVPAPATVITPSFQVPLPRVRGAVAAIVAAATVEAMAPLLIVRAVEVAPPSV